MVWVRSFTDSDLPGIGSDFSIFWYRIAHTLKTTGQILMQFYQILCVLVGKKWTFWPWPDLGPQELNLTAAQGMLPPTQFNFTLRNYSLCAFRSLQNYNYYFCRYLAIQHLAKSMLSFNYNYRIVVWSTFEYGEAGFLRYKHLRSQCKLLPSGLLK